MWVRVQAKNMGRSYGYVPSVPGLLGVRFAAFSASSLALISECGTATSLRIKSVNFPKSPTSFWGDRLGVIGISR